jgi:hypothetical protein
MDLIWTAEPAYGGRWVAVKSLLLAAHQGCDSGTELTLEECVCWKFYSLVFSLLQSTMGPEVLLCITLEKQRFPIPAVLAGHCCIPSGPVCWLPIWACALPMEITWGNGESGAKCSFQEWGTEGCAGALKVITSVSRKSESWHPKAGQHQDLSVLAVFHQYQWLRLLSQTCSDRTARELSEDYCTWRL